MDDKFQALISDLEWKHTPDSVKDDIVRELKRDYPEEYDRYKNKDD